MHLKEILVTMVSMGTEPGVWDPQRAVSLLKDECLHTLREKQEARGGHGALDLKDNKVDRKPS
jgi:hypothetical protein